MVRVEQCCSQITAVKYSSPLLKDRAKKKNNHGESHSASSLLGCSRQGWPQPIIFLHLTLSSASSSLTITSCPSLHPEISSLLFSSASCLPTPTSASSYWCFHCPSSVHVQAISLWLWLQNIQHVVPHSWSSPSWSLSKWSINILFFHICLLSPPRCHRRLSILKIILSSLSMSALRRLSIWPAPWSKSSSLPWLTSLHVSLLKLGCATQVSMHRCNCGISEMSTE